MLNRTQLEKYADVLVWGLKPPGEVNIRRAT